jgi:NDP-sugar pyrophosphorylase family protein
MTLYPAIILAGGLATRLRPMTETIPKALIDIDGEPFIAHQLRLLYQKGIRRVILCVGYLGDMLQDYLGDGSQFGMQVQYVFDGDKLLGTAGAIKKALPLIDDNFFVIYGDSYLPCDYAAVQKAFSQQQKLGLMTVFHNEGKWDTSNVEYQNGAILNYDKKNRNERMHYIDYGLGVFNKSAFNAIPENTEYDLALLYQNLLKQNELAAYEITQRFYEVGSFNGIDELRSLLCNL